MTVGDVGMTVGDVGMTVGDVGTTVGVGPPQILAFAGMTVMGPDLWGIAVKLDWR